MDPARYAYLCISVSFLLLVTAYIIGPLAWYRPGCEILSPCFLTMSRYLQSQPAHRYMEKYSEVWKKHMHVKIIGPTLLRWNFWRRHPHPTKRRSRKAPRCSGGGTSWQTTFVIIFRHKTEDCQCICLPVSNIDSIYISGTTKMFVVLVFRTTKGLMFKLKMPKI